MGREDRVPAVGAGRAQLLAERPDYWEYFHFADALVRRLAEHDAAWRDHQLRLVRADGEHVAPGDVQDHIDRSSRQMVGMLRNVSRLLDPAANATLFGSDERYGDPAAIEHHAERLVEIYRFMLDWAAALRSTRVAEDHERLFDLLASFADQPLSEFRAFVESCAAEMGNVPVLLATPGDAPMTLRLALTVTVDDVVVRAYEKEAKRLRRRGKL